MPRSAKPLQGSLFEDTEDLSLETGNTSENIETQISLSEQDLAKDALKRPRKRKIDERDTSKNNISRHLQQNTESDEDGLPPWSDQSLIDKDELTPMLSHYVELKRKNPERVLLYRLGDFFECFFEDAIKLSRILELTLTGKEAGKKIGRVPMAGIPHHAADRYCGELIKRGLSVAICDQLETTATKGSLLKRDITRVLTPGTVIEEGMLNARRNNWLAAIITNHSKESNTFFWGLATADVSTGEFLVMQRQSPELLQQELSKLQAAEILLSNCSTSNLNNWQPERLPITNIPNTPFSLPEAETTLKTHFKLQSIHGLGLQEWPLALRAAGGLLQYLRATKPKHFDQIQEDKRIDIALDVPKIIFAENTLVLDSQTRRNLELTNTQRDGRFQGSLLWSIDRTLTSMGGRCLRKWLEEPLIDIKEINARQKIVSTLVEQRSLRKVLRKLLRSMGDLERLAGRASAGHAGARDIVAIAEGIEKLPKLAIELVHIKCETPSWFKSLLNVDHRLLNLADTIRDELIDTPPLSLKDGGLIHDGVNQILDGLRNQLDDQDAWLKEQEEFERKSSGNNNIRIHQHRNFGYFLSVTKAKANAVPEHWISRSKTCCCNKSRPVGAS